MEIKNFMIIPFTKENFSSNSIKITIADNKINLPIGDYTLFLSITIDKENLGDALTLYLNDNIIYEIEIPLYELDDHEIKLQIPIKVNSDNSSLFLINESDDTVLIKNLNGGIFMNVNLQIIDITNFNPYSFDLELNTPFTSDITVSVTELIPDGTKNQISVSVLEKLDLNSEVDNSNVRTIIPTNAPTILFKPNYEYLVEVKNTLETISIIKSFDFTTFPMINNSNCKITPIGSRLLVLEFDYPVKNLDATTTYLSTDGNISSKALNNLYISYFGSDPNIGDSSNVWVGSIDLEKTISGSETSYNFSYNVSPDSRRIEIQNNLAEFNTGSDATQKNHITINGSKFQDSTKALSDYSNRYIAPFEMEFLSTRNSIAAKVTSIEAKSNYQVIVTFDNPVCSIPEHLDSSLFKLYQVIPDKPDQLLTIDNVERIGNDFNKLLFTLTSSSLLPFPETTVKVGPVLDASGLKTEEFSQTILVPVIYPTVSFDSVYFDPITKTTNITLKYSDIMDTTPNGANSSINPANYLLTNINSSTNIKINKITSNSTSPFTITITCESVATGDYSVTAYDTIKSTSQNNIQTTVIPFNVVNTVIPKISKVLATTPIGNDNISADDNSFVIIFDQDMNLQKSDVHSVLNANNYKLKTNSKYHLLDECTKIEEIYDNKWIRYTLPVNDTNPIPVFIEQSDNYLIHAGYAAAKNIKWITSADGNIYPLCDVRQIDHLINKLDIKNGTALAISENTISYELNSDIDSPTIVNNLFYSVSSQDFEVKVTRNGETTTIRPLSVTLEPDSFKKVTLTFEDESFIIGDSIVLSVNPEDSNVQSLDIFGKPIVKNTASGIGEITVTNKIPTSIEGISLLSSYPVASGWYSNGLIELKFAKDILETEANDFDVYYLDSTNAKKHCNVRSATIVDPIATGRTNTINLEAELPYEVNDQILNNLYVSTVPDNILTPFRTYDVDNNKVSNFENHSVSVLNITSFNWIYQPAAVGGYDSYIFELGFSDNISTKYAVGTPDTPNSITATMQENNTLLLDLMNDDASNFLNLGSIKLFFTNDISFDGETYNWNASAIISDSDPSKLIITVTNTADDNLFADGKVDQSTNRSRAAYIPFTSDTIKSLIVDENDTNGQFRINIDTTKIQ